MICQHWTQALCDNPSKNLVVRVQECDGAVVFWCLVPLRLRQANYHIIFAFRWIKAVSVWSLGPGTCNISYVHSYKWFSIMQWSLRRSACSRWYSCRIFFLQRRSHHIVRSGKYPFFRFSCPHRVLNFSVHAFLVITALSIFRRPRLLRVIGRSDYIRRRTMLQ